MEHSTSPPFCSPTAAATISTPSPSPPSGKRPRTSSLQAQCATTSAATALEERLWVVFGKERTAKHWERGCVCLSGFARASGPDSSTAYPLQQSALEGKRLWFQPHPWKQLCPPSLSGTSEAAGATDGRWPVVKVPIEQWNAYWQAYSDMYGDSLDSLDAALQAGKGSTSSVYRNVLLAVSISSNTSSSEGTSGSPAASPSPPPEPEPSAAEVLQHIDDVIAPFAMSFGAVELVRYERKIVRVQFTTPQAAQLFQVWAAGLPLVSLLETHAAEHVTVAVPEALRHALAGMTLVARLAPYDTRLVARHLLLGPRLLLSTAFVDSLFKGMFGAAAVQYQPQTQSFLLEFETADAATLALHALQRSLWKVFQLSLVPVPPREGGVAHPR